MQHQFLINNKILHANSLSFFDSLDYGEKLYLGVVTLNGVDYVVLYLDDCKACIKKSRKLSRKFRIDLTIKEVSRDTDSSMKYDDITKISCSRRKQNYRVKKRAGNPINKGLPSVNLVNFSGGNSCLSPQYQTSSDTLAKDKTSIDNMSNTIKPKKKVALNELFI